MSFLGVAWRNGLPAIRGATLLRSSMNLKRTIFQNEIRQHFVSLTPKSPQKGNILAFSKSKIQPINFNLRSPTTTFATLSTSKATDSLPWRQKVMGSWLLLSGGLVYGIVILGGLTRLTESGLSIVEWKPFKGAIPPMTLAEWEEEFEKYKQSPEFKINNFDITLEQFKKIFWMEWAHRQLGRFIGLEFLLPAIFFVARGWVNKGMALKIGGITTLIGFQGLIGWLMVKSGLDEKIVEEQGVPRVSHYRLAAHLGTAFAIYSAMLWCALELFTKPITDPKVLAQLSSPQMKRFKAFSAFTLGMVATTALSGALVAGLDAGLVYNEFPLMGGRLIPVEFWKLTPAWHNFLENPATVQFDHRYLAISTATVIGGLYLYSRKLALPKISRIAVIHVAGMVLIQVGLGITTLIYFAPIPLASAHQAGSVALLSFSLWLVHTLKAVPK